MSIIEVLSNLNIPVAYGFFREPTVLPPYVVVMGAGQDTMRADNDIYYKNNRYRIEYYFTEKNEEKEEEIEALLTANGWLYEKSEDIYIESENVYVIYYTI